MVASLASDDDDAVHSHHALAFGNALAEATRASDLHDYSRMRIHSSNAIFLSWGVDHLSGVDNDMPGLWKHIHQLLKLPRNETSGNDNAPVCSRKLCSKA